MYGESRITTNVALVAPVTFAVGTVPGGAGGSLRFSVEEEEMIVELEFQGSVAHSLPEGIIDATFFVDGVDVADLVDGIVRHHGSVAGVAVPGALYLRKKARLAQGEHRVEVRFKSPAGDIIVAGLLHPARLAAHRHTHNATVAANANSKQAGGVY